LTADPSLEGDTARHKVSTMEEPDEMKIDSNYLKTGRSTKEEQDATSVKSNFRKLQLPKDTTGKTGVSSMESGSSPSGGKRVSFGSLAKDSKANLGVSSMVAEVSPRGSEATNVSGGQKGSVVRFAKDSTADIGGSSMDAEVGPRDGGTETDIQSSKFSKLDDSEYKSPGDIKSLGKMLSVLTISIKKANSVRNPTKFIYDTAAGCCICNSKDVFVEGSLRMIPDDQVSIVGFNTSHGPAIALGVGKLKYLDIESYYSENAIGNILGEPALLKSFQADFKYVPGQMVLDKITVTRLQPKEGDQPMIFRRGVEGIMICPVPERSIGEDWLVCSTLVSDDNDPVTVWLKEYGLTEREIQATVVLRKLSEEHRKTSLKKMLCVLENDHECRADESLARYLCFKSKYVTYEESDIMSCASEILEALRSWRPVSESLDQKDKETCKNKTCRPTKTNSLNSVRVNDMCLECVDKDQGDSLPESLASKFSDSETWAALSIVKLRLSYGELMVALFAVDAGLAAADTFVAMTLKQKGFTLAGIARLEKVERLHRLTSFVNLRTLKDMISNKIVEVDGLQSKHVDAYRMHVHELDCACHEGKVKKPSAIKNVNLAELCTSACHIDVMTETTDDKEHRYLHLIGVDAATQCIFEVKVPELTERALATALIAIEDIYKRHKKPLTQFVLDNAAGFSTTALQKECLRRNITVVQVTPDHHVKLAEAAIKIVKSLVRTTVVDRESKGKFITSFVTYLITWVVGSINYTLRSGSRTETPWTRFTGIAISMDIHFRAAFLDIVVVNKLEQERTNNLESRGFIGLVVGRDKSGRGALTILNIQTKKICKRYHFKLVQSDNLTKYVNDQLNDPIFKSTYIAKDDSDIANADIGDFEINLEDVAAAHKEIARLVQSKKVSSVEGEVALPAQAKTQKNKKKRKTEVQALITLGSGIRSQTAKVEFIPNSKAFAIDQLSDGTCMFASICFCYAKGSQEADPIRLRQEVCDYMEQNLNTELNELSIRDFIDMIRLDLMKKLPHIRLNSTEEYIEYMRRPTTYGDSLELKLIAKIKKIAIIIYKQVAGGFELVEENTQFSEEGRIIYLNYTGQIHYETLIIDDEATRLKHKLKYGIQSSKNNKEGAFNYSINSMKSSEFDYEEHEDSLILQSEVNRAWKPHNATSESAAPTKIISSEEDFEEEEIHTYDEQEKIREYEEEHKILVNFVDISLPRPYSAEYEDMYEPHSSGSIPEIMNDNDFIMCCAAFTNMSMSVNDPIEVCSINKNAILRQKVGDEIVDNASRKEMEQILHKKVMKFQTQTQVRKLYDNRTDITPLVDLIKEKLLSNGEHEKVKSRIIVLGHLMKPSVESKTEAPTAQMQSFYMLVFIAAKRKIRLKSHDVTGAFLNAALEKGEIVYVRLTKRMAQLAVQLDKRLAEYVLDDGSMIAQLLKCLYGMGISPQRWFKTIRKLLRKLGFKESSWDPCFFYKTEEGDVLNFVLLYVDDLLIACENKELETAIYDAMIAEFEGVSTQEGDVISYLGFTITQSDGQITLDQTGYIMKLVKSLKVDLSEIPNYTNPFASNFKINDDRYLRPAKEADVKLLWTMKHLAMSMMYLACRTRRDLLFSSSFFAGVKCPTAEDIEAVKRVIFYAYNTKEKKQVFYQWGPIKMSGVGDASHSLFADTRGQACAIIFGDDTSAALEMSSNVEKFLSKSSYESELVLQNKLAMMMKRTMLMFRECGVQIAQPMNQSWDHLEVVKTMNKEHLLKSGPSKFMSRNLFQLFAEVVNKIINFLWVASRLNRADIGTKDLRGSQFQTLADQTFSRLVGLPDEEVIPK